MAPKPSQRDENENGIPAVDGSVYTGLFIQDGGRLARVLGWLRNVAPPLPQQWSMGGVYRRRYWNQQRFYCPMKNPQPVAQKTNSSTVI